MQKTKDKMTIPFQNIFLNNVKIEFEQVIIVTGEFFEQPFNANKVKMIFR